AEARPGSVAPGGEPRASSRGDARSPAGTEASMSAVNRAARRAISRRSASASARAWKSWSLRESAARIAALWASTSAPCRMTWLTVWSTSAAHRRMYSGAASARIVYSSPAIVTVTVDFVVDWFTCAPPVARAGHAAPPASPTIVLHEPEPSGDAAHAGARLFDPLAQRRVLGFELRDPLAQLERIHDAGRDLAERLLQLGDAPLSRLRAAPARGVLFQQPLNGEFGAVPFRRHAHWRAPRPAARYRAHPSAA